MFFFTKTRDQKSFFGDQIVDATRELGTTDLRERDAMFKLHLKCQLRSLSKTNNTFRSLI